MQTRKRAKSVTFGKKHKEKEEPKKEEEVIAAESEKDSSAQVEQEAPEERKVTKEKEPQFELSETLPKNEPEEEKEEAKEEEKSEVETPTSEFVSDGALASAPESSKNSKEEAAATPEEHPAAPAEPEELSQPVEPSATAPAATEPEGQQAEDAESGLPPSAFTIQSNEAPAQVAAASAPVAEGGKKRFGLYFFVVAFTAFILGLGAMAAASYFGLFGANTKLPTNITMPGILGQKPTPTTPPPTVKPTEKPVDLTAFTISVLNGSGISGKAADEKTALTTAGFKVTSTGNADTNDFTQTKIAAKKSVDPQFLTKLEEELKKSYDVDTSVTLTPDSSPADVVVTLGKSGAQ
jgi:hypothetical protein